MKGWIYIATNEEIPNLIKVGKTESDPDERAKQLSSPTGVPGETRIVYSAWVDDYHDIERAVLSNLDEKKVTKTGEWIRAETDEVIAALKTVIKSSSANLIFEENRLAPTQASIASGDWVALKVKERQSRIKVKCSGCGEVRSVDLPCRGLVSCVFCHAPLLAPTKSNSDPESDETKNPVLDNDCVVLDHDRVKKLEDVCNTQSKDLFKKDSEIESLEIEIKTLEGKIESVTPKTFIVCGACGMVTKEHVDLDEEDEDSDWGLLDDFECSRCGVHIGSFIEEPDI